MLCITRHDRTKYITMGPGGINHSQVSAFYWSSQYRIVLSWELLPWISVEDRILGSFTDFITTPELSGPLYISPGIYHAQITEYSLQTIYQWASFLSALNVFLIVLLDPTSLCCGFLDRTGASGNIFPMLFRLKRFLIYCDQLVHITLYVITPQNWCLIFWRLLLSGLRWVVNEYNVDRKTPQTKNPICV